MKNRLWIAGSCVSFLVSVMVLDPYIQNYIQSDVVYIYFRSLGIEPVHFNVKGICVDIGYQHFRGIIPYRDYVFEYPPIPAAVFTILMGFSLTRKFHPIDPILLNYLMLFLLSIVYVLLFCWVESRAKNFKFLTLLMVTFYLLVLVIFGLPLCKFYFLFAIFCAISHVILLHECKNIAELLSKKRYKLIICSPTISTLSLHNWDIFSAAFLMKGAKELLLNRRRGLYFIALSVPVKLLTIFPLIALLIILRKKYNVTFSTLLKIVNVAILPFLVIPIISWKGFNKFIWWLSNWYFENSIWILITNNIIIAKIFFWILMIVFYAILLIIVKNVNLNTACRYDVISRLVFALLVIPPMFSYVFTPQMFINIIPLGILLYSTFMYIADVFNALIILGLYLDASYGISSFLFPSHTQLFAQCRNVFLLTILILSVYELYRLSKEERKLEERST